MIDRRALLTDLLGVMRTIEADLLERSESADVPDVAAALKDEFARANEAHRTAQNYVDWRAAAITQAAAAWVLSCVFARFLEDNGLVETPRLAGPGDRLSHARDQHEIYFRAHPAQTYRDYLLASFDALASLPGAAEIFGPHNPIRQLPRWLSGDAAKALLGFFQRIDAATGALVHDFSDPSRDTRFLGDLYQDLSEAARKRYALLQTPVFVEEFILDRALDPALDEFGLGRVGYGDRLRPDGLLDPADRFRMIDPACGSGHFLLGALARLLDRWRRREPGARTSVLVQRALDSVHGVDLNPYAIAIARFRLLILALHESGVRRLADAPDFQIHLACGDSLLHGTPGGDQMTTGWADIDHVYQPEDGDALRAILRPGHYHAVVANPPYITPKDSALNQAYRDRYITCHRQYSLAVPFLERVMSLTVEGGFTGQITANSFMKREFGKKLIETFLPTVDLTHVVDTSGAYIPGHGTPTVLLFARRQRPVASTLRTVLGIRGEPSTPDDPARGLVWSAIVAQINHPGSQSDFVSVGDSPRELFHRHPWSIGGGGAAELKERLEESCEARLSDHCTEIGFICITKADEFFMQPSSTFSRARLECDQVRPFGIGEQIRDWSFDSDDSVVFPYDENIKTVKLSDVPILARFAWPYRTELGNRIVFGGRTYFEAGKPWHEYGQIPVERAKIPLSIPFAFVATHNHFVLDRGGKVFNRTAPVIKLPAGASEEEHLALLGLLNSSTACFWMKQMCSEKGGSGEWWEWRYEFDGTKVGRFPIPDVRLEVLPGQQDELALRLDSLVPAGLLQRWEHKGIMPGSGIRESFAVCHREWADLRERMIALQEELDWACYRLYGLIDDDLTYAGEPPPIRLGARAFEIAMGRQMAAGTLQTTWFERHGSTPLPAPHPEWPADYQALVRRRIDRIATNPSIALIEQPEYKRRWNTEPWADQQERALRTWMLDRLESYLDLDGRMNEAGVATAKGPLGLISVNRLADLARQDPTFQEVGAVYRDDPAFDVAALVAELVEAESVPLLPVLRYKPAGLIKRREWERVWDLQRREDAIRERLAACGGRPEGEALAAVRSALGELRRLVGVRSEEGRLLADPEEELAKLAAAIAVPPKYTSADFLKGDFWRLRGKLDVPKERWVSLPHCEGSDGTLMVAWAGYDHLQLARAISAHYVDVQEHLGGRDDPRLVPLLAGLIELLPWIRQWHNEIDPEFGLRMSDYFDGFVVEEARQMGKTLDEIRAWVPPQRAGGRGRRRTTAT